MFLSLIIMAALAAQPNHVSPTETLIRAEKDPALAAILTHVVENHPEIAAARAGAEALAQRAPQVKSLPDPMAALTAFLLAPETRVGPQRITGSISQRFPWFGKLKLNEKAALYEAAAARARVEAVKLRLVTRARKLYYEIGFLDTHRRLVEEDKETLSHFEELARARYASGAGLQQPIIKIQTEITRDETRLLDIDRKRVNRLAALNALRRSPQDTRLPSVTLPAIRTLHLSWNPLFTAALHTRPEILASDWKIEAWRVRMKRAKKNTYPDITVGLTYTVVGRRSDADPESNGRDILGLGAAVNLPIHRERIAAGVEEAARREVEAEASRQSIITTIEEIVGDTIAKIPLIWDQWKLFRDVLVPQADQSINSTMAGYSAGTLNALDLLDAQRFLLQVRIASERTRMEYLVALVSLEGSVGRPLNNFMEETDEK